MPIGSTRRELLKSSYLLGISNLVLSPSQAGTEGQNHRAGRQGQKLADFETRPVPYPTDPFITTMSGEFSLTEDGVASVVSLHPNVLAGAKHRNGPEFSFETGIPASRQMWLASFFDEYHIERTKELRKQNSWTYPDGTPVEDAQGILAETYDGTPYQRWDHNVIPSIFAPAMVDLVQDEASRHFESGYSAVQFGNARIPRIEGLDFSNWARAAFQEYLNELPADRLEELGVGDTDSFDIREYLKAEGLTPDASAHPAEDPLFREYLLFHHKGIKALLSDLSNWVSKTFPERSPPFYMDQPMGDPNLWECAVVETYASEHVDLISVEDYRTMPAVDFEVDEHDRRVVPEKDIRDFVYKLALATGRYEKPVFGWDTFGGSYYPDVASDDYFPRLLRLQAAEAYAMGCRRRLARRDAPMSWHAPNGRLPSVLRDFVDFLWAHQRFLRDIEPANKVAVVWSLPTLLWNTIPQWTINATDHTTAFLGTATLLRESQIPYDVRVFGHPELWPDNDNLEALSEYEAVILPQVQSITEDQLTALESVVNEDGLVVTGGEKPDRTGYYERSEGGFDVFDAATVVNVVPDPGMKRLTDGTGGKLPEVLQESGIESVVKGSDDSIGVNLLRQSSKERLIAHLLNYDYNPDADEFNSKQDVEIRVETAGIEMNAARFYSPQQITDVDIQERNGRYVVTVPEVTEWGFVAMAPSKDHFADSGSKQQAESRISEAAAKLQEVQEAGLERTAKLIRAEVALRSARVALEYEAFTLATETANTVIHLAEAVLPSPTPTTEQLTSKPDVRSTPPNPTNSPGQPGFNALSTLVGLGGAAYLLKRQLSRQKGDHEKPDE